MSTAQDVAYHWLKDHIAGLPRDRSTFLTETAVAAEAGVSRTPVREALLRLESEGLVQIQPKKGAFVPAISDAEVETTMQARLVVEQWAAVQVTDSAGAGLLPQLRQLLGQQTALLDESDPRAFIEADRSFHRVIVQAAGNPELAAFYESLRDRQIRMGLQAVTRRPDRGQSVIDEHDAIVAAIVAGDPDLAEQAVTLHLSNTLQLLAPRAQLTPTRGRSVAG